MHYYTVHTHSSIVSILRRTTLHCAAYTITQYTHILVLFQSSDVLHYTVLNALLHTQIIILVLFQSSDVLHYTVLHALLHTQIIILVLFQSSDVLHYTVLHALLHTQIIIFNPQTYCITLCSMHY